MINEVTLIGRVGKKDTRTLKNGSELSTIYLATNRKWTDSDGKTQEQTTWHNVNFFNKLSDIVKKYVEVGNLVYIKGEVNHKQITHGDRQGQWAYSVTAQAIRILPTSPKKQNETKVVEPEQSSFDDSDIPF